MLLPSIWDDLREVRNEFSKFRNAVFFFFLNVYGPRPPARTGQSERAMRMSVAQRGAASALRCTPAVDISRIPPWTFQQLWESECKGCENGPTPRVPVPHPALHTCIPRPSNPTTEALRGPGRAASVHPPGTNYCIHEQQHGRYVLRLTGIIGTQLRRRSAKSVLEDKMSFGNSQVKYITRSRSSAGQSGSEQNLWGFTNIYSCWAIL